VPSRARAQNYPLQQNKQMIAPGNSWHVLSTDWPQQLDCGHGLDAGVIALVKHKAMSNDIGRTVLKSDHDNGVVVDGVPLYIQNIPLVFCEHLSIWFQVSSKKWRVEINDFRSYYDVHIS